MSGLCRFTLQRIERRTKMVGIKSIHSLPGSTRGAHAYEEEFSFLLYNNFLLGGNDTLLYTSRYRSSSLLIFSTK